MDGGFQVGSWRVDPSLNTISRNGTATQIEPKVMEVLVCLARHSGETLPKERLLQEVWPGTFVSDDALKRCILELRRAFEDDARDPQVIQTVAKRGYRLVAVVEPLNGRRTANAVQDQDRVVAGTRIRSSRIALPLLIGVILLIALLASNPDRVRRWLGVGTTSQIHSIAVLPLRNLSSDPNQEYFSDGLTDALITDLAQIGSIKVISHTSTMQYKDVKKTLPEIARELNVDGIIEGTVQRSGDRVRITAQLIHGPSDKHLWANSYEREMRDVFVLERDVTQDIVRQIQSRLSAPEQSVLAPPKPVDPKVLEAYLRGNYHLGRYGEGSGQEEQNKAAKYFQQAIDIDPNFAPAYVGLAAAHRELLLGSSEDVSIGEKSLEKAVELDPNNSDAHAWLGWLKWQPLLDWQGSEAEFRRAIALNPNSVDGHALFSLLLITAGRKEDGLREAKIAQQLDPTQDNMSMPLYLAHDYDGSIAMLRMMELKGPSRGERHFFLFQNYSEKNMPEEAIQELEQSYLLFGQPKMADSVRQAYQRAGYRGAIQEWANELEHLLSTHQAFLPGNIATAYAILGNKDRAFYWLEQAYQHREMVSVDSGIYFLPADPKYDALHSDQRYKDLLRRIGLPQ